MLGPLLLAFCDSKAGVTFCLAMSSIGSGLKPRASQRCRNNCLTLEMENGPRQIFRFAAPPRRGASGGRGGPVSRALALSLLIAWAVRPPTTISTLKGLRLLLSRNDFNERGLKPRASQRCRNNCFLSRESGNWSSTNCQVRRDPPPPWSVRGAGVARDSRAETKLQCYAVSCGNDGNLC